MLFSHARPLKLEDQFMRRNRRNRRKEKIGRLQFADDLMYKVAQRFPVEVGDIVRLKITEMTTDKVGIARIGLYRINIPGSRIGDEVKVKIVKVDEKEALAEIIE